MVEISSLGTHHFQKHVQFEFESKNEILSPPHLSYVCLRTQVIRYFTWQNKNWDLKINEIETRCRHTVLRSTFIKAPLVDGIISLNREFLGVFSNCNLDMVINMERYSCLTEIELNALKQKMKLTIVFFCKFYHCTVTLWCLQEAIFCFPLNPVLRNPKWYLRPILISSRAWWVLLCPYWFGPDTFV